MDQGSHGGEGLSLVLHLHGLYLRGPRARGRSGVLLPNEQPGASELRSRASSSPMLVLSFFSLLTEPP